MNTDTRNEALDNIQDIANFLLALNDLPNEARECLRMVEALARHRDLSNFLGPADQERLDRIKRSAQ